MTTQTQSSDRELQIQIDWDRFTDDKDVMLVSSQIREVESSHYWSEAREDQSISIYGQWLSAILSLLGLVGTLGAFLWQMLE